MLKRTIDYYRRNGSHVFARFIDFHKGCTKGISYIRSRISASNLRDAFGKCFMRKEKIKKHSTADSGKIVCPHLLRREAIITTQKVVGLRQSNEHASDQMAYIGSGASETSAEHNMLWRPLLPTTGDE